MPQSLSAVYVHLVFSTKDRRPFLSNPAARTALHAYLGASSKRLECAPIRVGGTADHVHLLGRMSRTCAIADWVKELKRVSSGWIHTGYETLPDFAWQAGYGAFSVSHSNLGIVTEYIENQEEHHRRMDFQDEFRGLCRRHDIEIDERYVWD